jgi:hypothetical protein
MRFINLANKSACVLLFLAGVLVLADAVAFGAEGGVTVEVVPSVVAAAFAAAGFPMYLLKQTGDLLRLRWKDLVSAVMTTQAENRISHGLFVVRTWLTDQSTGVALISYCSRYHMYRR